MPDLQHIKRVFHYDPIVGVFTWLKPSKYHPDLVGANAGAVTPNRAGKSYVAIQWGGKKYKRARLAFFYMTGRWPTNQIDHINGDSLDDRWENLREATAAENAWNHKSRAKASSLPMGVRVARSGRFVARISHNGNPHTIGTFDTIDAAAAAYQQERKVRYGEFA